MLTSVNFLAVLCLLVSSVSLAGTRGWEGNWIGRCSDSAEPQSLSLKVIPGDRLMIRVEDSMRDRVLMDRRAEFAEEWISEFGNGFAYDDLKTSPGINDPKTGRVRHCEETDTLRVELHGIDRLVVISKSQNSQQYCRGESDVRRSPLVEVYCSYIRSR